MAETRTFNFFSADLNGNGSVDATGLNAPVVGEFPLEPGELATVFTRTLEYQGSDGAGGGIFLDPTDASQVYVSDDTRLNFEDPFPEPQDEPLPLDPDAPPPQLAIVPFNLDVFEGDDSTTEYRFEVIRLGDLSGESSVDVVFTAGGTDVDDGVPDGVDFGGSLPETQTVNFAVGEMHPDGDLLEVSGDTDIEPDETFTLRLDNPVGAELSAFLTAEGKIVNDDVAAPVITIRNDGFSSIRMRATTGTKDYSFIVERSGGDLSGTSSVEVVFDAGGTDAADFGGRPAR